MRVIVPFDATNPKTRLSPVLDEDDRETFARVMLDDVLATFERTEHDPEILATERVDSRVPVTVDDRPLTDAVNDVLAGADRPVAVVMADLALVTVEALEALFEPTESVVIAPGLGGGTNGLAIRHPSFRVDYHGTSYRDHCTRAESLGADVRTVDSFRLALDVDDPEDIVEVLLHGTGDVPDWLRDRGFRLDESDGRTTAVRSGESG
jgi:2-phospho-L-lactate guanylyltransferase